jgi:hypothetical protein
MFHRLAVLGKVVGLLALFATATMAHGIGTATVTCTTQSTNASNFDGTSINGGSYIWFNANFTASGIPKTGATIFFQNSTIQFTADQTYSVAVPSAQITFSPNVACASTYFDGQTWMTTVPISGSDEIFLSGVAFPVPFSFAKVNGKVTGPVTWQGTFSSTTAGMSINWKWGAAVYTTFTTDYNQLAIKPTHSKACGAMYNNGDHAGTPEGVDYNNQPWKQFLVGGARGGGGSNWTGGWSGTRKVGPICQAGVPVLVRSGGGASATPDASGTVSFSAPSTSGNTIVLFVRFGGTTISNVSDSLNNTYTSVLGPTQWGALPNSTDRYAQVFVAKNITGGSTLTITVTLAGASTHDTYMVALEYSGVDHTNPVNATAYGTGSFSTAAPATTYLNTTVAYAQLVATSWDSNESYTATGNGIGYSTDVAAGIPSISGGRGWANLTEDRTAPAVGSWNATASLSPNVTDWAIQLVALTPATSP